MANAGHRLESIVRNLSALPSLPFVATKVVQVTNNPASKASDIAEVIAVDQSLSAKLLKLVNSSFYGFSTPITTVSRAIVVLGLETIKNLALGVTVFKTTSNMGGVSAGLDMEKFWEHSVGVGAGARLIANMTGYKGAEEAFLAGLLHDIGKIVFTQYLPKEFSEAIFLARKERIPLFEAERKIIHADHEVAGDYLAERWKLPHELRRVINSHHNPPFKDAHVLPEVLQLICIVSLSNTLCKMRKIGTSGSEVITPKDESVMHFLKVDESMIERFFLEIDAELTKAKEFLGIATAKEEDEEALTETQSKARDLVLIIAQEKSGAMMPSLYLKSIGLDCELLGPEEDVTPYLTSQLQYIFTEGLSEEDKQSLSVKLKASPCQVSVSDLPKPFDAGSLMDQLGIEVQEATPEEEKKETTSKPGRRIMIVDDKDGDAQVIRDFLVEAGYEVMWVRDPENTIVHVREFKPHGVILALEMSGINGLTLIQLLKTFLQSDIQTRHTQIVVVASFFNAEIVKKLIGLQIKEIVKKPYKPDVFVEKLRVLLS